MSQLKDVCPFWLTGSGITVGLQVQQEVAADEAGHPRHVQRDQNVLTDPTPKTHLPAPPIKTLLDPATKSHPRGKAGHYHN